MFGKTVLDLEGERFEDAMDAIKEGQGRHRRPRPRHRRPARPRRGLQGDHPRGQRRGVPQDPKAQLMGAVEAVFNSWNSDRAVLYRRRERIPPSDLGTAVNVQAMVFGNRGMDSGSGSPSPVTRPPAP
jgi:pyruvate,orthophosphate dikinase